MPLTKSVNQGSQAVSTEQSIASASSSSSAAATSEKPVTSDEAKVCWIGVKRSPYQPDHQVELLHLQAEADALLIKLQASASKE